MEVLTNNLVKQRQKYPEKILQFGEGNFLRGFVDWQIDVMNKKGIFNGSVVVVQPRGQEKIEKLKCTGWTVYTLLTGDEKWCSGSGEFYYYQY